MKSLKLYLLITIIITSISSNGQEKSSSFFQKSTTIGGFGGISINVNDYGKSFISGEGAMIISNYYFGGFGYGVNIGDFHSPNTGSIYDINQGEGGFMIGAISNKQQLISLFCELRFGFGEVDARSEIDTNIFELYQENTFSITSKIGLTISPLNYIQLKAFAGYQGFNDIDLNGINQDVLNGFRWGFSLYFGYFK